MKQQYKLMKPQMGVFVIKCLANNKCHLQAAKDLKSAMNGAEIKLEGGFHPYRELQREYGEFGRDGFVFEVLERLDYEKDESKTDYSEELELLKLIWEDRLKTQNFTFYDKR